MRTNAQIKPPGNVSEIQALTDRSQALSSDINWWNGGYVWGGAFALILAFWVFWAQFRIIRKGRELSDVQSALIAAKDRLLQSNLKDKDDQLEAAKRESKEKTDALELKAKQAEGDIQTARSDAAKANEHAANADRLTEKERLERLKLEAQIAPRRLTNEQANNIVTLYRPILAGKSVRVESYALDIEGMILADQLRQVFEASGMKVEPFLGSRTSLGGIDLGVHVSGTDEATVSAIRFALRHAGGFGRFRYASASRYGIADGSARCTTSLGFRWS